MKRIFLMLSFLVAICNLANNDANLSESKFSITKKDNLSIDAIYKREFKPDIDDLKTYFKNGNTIGLNFTYFIGDSKKNKGMPNKIYVANLVTNNSNLNRKEIQYELKNQELKTVVHKINDIINVNNIKVNIGNTETYKKDKVSKTLVLLNRYGKDLQKKYGQISKDKIVIKENENKKDKIVITFDRSI